MPIVGRVGVSPSRMSYRVTGGGASAFTPATLFAASEAGAWYDPSDLSTLWQDTGGTVAVTADGQSVARMDDKSGNGNHLTQATAGMRPVYHTDGTKHWLEYDGVDDILVAPIATSLPVDGVFALRQVTWNGGRMIGGRNPASLATNLVYQSPSTPSLSLYAGTTGAVNSDASVGTDFVLTYRFNGASSRQAVDNGSYATGDSGASRPDSVMFSIGNQPVSTSLPTNMLDYGGIVIDRNLTDAEISQARTHFAAKQGRTL